MAKNLNSKIVRMYSILRKIQELQEKYNKMKAEIEKDLENQPNKEYIAVDPKTGIRIEAKLVTREIWSIEDVQGFIDRFKDKTNIYDFLKVDGNKVKTASEKFGLFNPEELKGILKVKESRYVTLREIKRK